MFSNNSKNKKPPNPPSISLKQYAVVTLINNCTPVTIMGITLNKYNLPELSKSVTGLFLKGFYTRFQQYLHLRILFCHFQCYKRSTSFQSNQYSNWLFVIPYLFLLFFLRVHQDFSVKQIHLLCLEF